MKKSNKTIWFKVVGKDGRLLVDLGTLPWPWPINRVECSGELIEVFDKRGSSVFSLEDIVLGDLHDSQSMFKNLGELK